VAAAGGQQRRLIGQVGQIGAHHPRGRRGQDLQIDVFAQRHRAGVNLEDLLASGAVGRLHGHPAVKAPRAQEGAVQNLRAVGRPQHDHRLG
jgi:hypothetical protein